MCNQRSSILPTLLAAPPNDGRFSPGLSGSFMDHPLRTLVRVLLLEPILRCFGIGRRARVGRACEDLRQHGSNGGGPDSANVWGLISGVVAGDLRGEPLDTKVRQPVAERMPKRLARDC